MNDKKKDYSCDFISLTTYPQVNRIFAENAFDAVMHFAAVAYVGESTLEPLRYWKFTSPQSQTIIEFPYLNIIILEKLFEQVLS
jgi:UDP-glucose 4-epimerase